MNQFFEEYVAIFDDRHPKMLGVKILDKVPEGRKLGSPGRQLVTLTRPIELVKGVNVKRYKFSPAKRQKCWTMIATIERNPVTAAKSIRQDAQCK